MLRARLQEQRQQLVARLQEELSAVGGKVVRVQSVAEATQYVTQLALDLDASLIVRWQSDILDALEIDATFTSPRRRKRMRQNLRLTPSARRCASGWRAPRSACRA
jgi:hypothetical protein